MNEQTFPFLSAGGEMGVIMREKDWASTPLGSPDLWPTSLCNTVSLLLKSRFPMLLWWGPAYIQIYNDAYRVVFSDEKHPLALGQPGELCWQELWPVVMDESLKVELSGEASWNEDRPVTVYQDGIAETIHWSYSYNPVIDESGQHQGILVICSDTTRSAQALKRSIRTQRQVLAFFEESQVAIAIIDKQDLTFRMANPFYGVLVGRRPNDMIGKTLLEAIPELEGQGFERLLNEVIQTGQPFLANELEVKLIRDDKLETVFVNLTFRAHQDTDQQITGVLVVATDVTQQVTSRKNIEDSEKILREMILNAPIGICLLNAQGLTGEIVNDSFIEVAGKAKEEIIGKNYWVPFAEAAPYYEEALNSVVSTATPFFANEVPLMLIRHGREEQVFVTFAYIPLIDTSGEVKKVVVWVLENTHQVTERRKIEEVVNERTQELNKRNDDLREANELLARSNDNLERFAYVASHDLQEPLRKIQQFGDMLRESHTDDQSKESLYIDRMLAATVRMSMLIRDLLDFSKISHQRADPQLVSLNEVVKQVLLTLERSVADSNAEVSVSELPQVLGDPMQMDQLFQNLLSNALKFTKPGQAPRIAINSHILGWEDLPSGIVPVQRSSQYYRIDVEDNGIGFDEQYLERIFQMFQRLHGKNDFAGTGIGLAIAEKVVVNHGGILSASSSLGQGSTFSVFLPVPG